MPDPEASDLPHDDLETQSSHPVSSLDEVADEPKDKRKRRARREDFQDDVPFNAANRKSSVRLNQALENAKAAARIGDDNRGKDILLLDLRAATALVDFFVIITASSRRLTTAIASEIDQEMKRRGEWKLGIEGFEEGSWVLIDYGDFVVHVFSEETRAFYALEDIWGDAERIDWEDPDRPRAKRVATETERANTIPVAESSSNPA